MLDTVLLEKVNLRLGLYYGIHSETGKQLFRVSWAPNEYEKRKVDFVGGIQLLAPEWRDTPKYPWMGAQYVVEKLTTNSSSELEGTYVYQPLFDFPEGLPLNELACEKVIQECLNRIPGALKEVVKEREETKLAEEKKIARDVLENVS